MPIEVSRSLEEVVVELGMFANENAAIFKWGYLSQLKS